MNIDKWIETKQELRELAKKLGVRDDWHNADCEGLEIMLYEDAFDNAHCDESEAHVVITHSDPAYTIDDEVRYAINAANLLAWACE